MALIENTLNFLTKITPILLGSYVFLNPFAFKLTALSEICFYSSSVLALILAYYKKIDFTFKTPLTLPFALLTGWAFIGLFFALYTENSIHDFLRHLVRYIIVFYLLVNFFNTRKRLENLGWIVIISGTLFLSGLAIYYFFILNSDFLTRINLTNIKNNEFGFIALPVLIFCLFYFSRATTMSKIFLTGAILISSFTLSQSMGSLLGAVLSLCVLAVKRRKSVLIYAGAILVLFLSINAGLFSYYNQASVSLLKGKIQTDIRKDIWLLYSNVVRDHPVTGIGFGLEMWQYDVFWNEYVNRLPDNSNKDILKANKLDPHNMFLSIAVHLGIVGLIIFVYLLFAAFRSLLKSIRKGRDDYIRDWAVCACAVLAGYLAKAMSEEALSNIGALTFYYTLAVTVIIGSLNKEMVLQEQQAQIAD